MPRRERLQILVVAINKLRALKRQMTESMTGSTIGITGETYCCRCEEWPTMNR